METLGTFPVYPVLAASDLDRAKEWYREKLGMTPGREDPSGLWYECAGGTWLLVYPTPSSGTAQNTQAHFAVTDIDALMDQLRERGVTFEEYDFTPFLKMHKGNGLYQMGDYRGGWFKDSEGNTIEIAQVG